MKALIVLDVQKGILKKKDFSNALKNIRILINDFKSKGDIVLLTQHFWTIVIVRFIKAPAM